MIFKVGDHVDVTYSGNDRHDLGWCFARTHFSNVEITNIADYAYQLRIEGTPWWVAKHMVESPSGPW